MAIDRSDPYPGLGRRVLFADVSGKVVCSPKRAAGVPIVIDRSEKAKEALVIAEKGAESLSTPKRRGRPTTGPKPWELEGVSRATYKRREALKRED